MSEAKKVYKVVRKVRDKLVSATHLPDDLLREYSTQKRTEAGVTGPSFAFENERAAKRFAKSLWNLGAEYQVWEADAWGCNRIHRVLWIGDFYDVVNFWRARGRGERLPKGVSHLKPPQGTVVCEAIRLVRRVDGGNNNAKK